MLAAAFIVVAATATTAAWVVLHRRRARRGLLVPLRPRAAGVHHLASSVSDLSDLGLHLRAARRAEGRPRLGAVLEQR